MIYIVIPVFNRKEFTRKCLYSLQEQTFTDFKIIIVDDGSTDGTDKMLEEEFPEVIRLETSGNLFWTASTNVGVEYALKQNPSVIMTLNNDVVAEPDFMEKMVYWSKREPNSLLGAFDVDYDTKKPFFGGEITDWKWATAIQLLEVLPEEDWNGIHEVTHYPARGLWIPVEVFKKIGLFEERKLPHYYADFDFTYRAARKGYKIYCNYDAVLYTFPDESGNHQIRKNKKTFQNFYKHLFDIKGGGNLRNFTIITLRHCPPVYMPLYLANGYARRMLGYWIKKQW
ncbi:MAG: glycosyltransferase family 2 protein [Bacteroidota bacterium]